MAQGVPISVKGAYIHWVINEDYPMKAIIRGSKVHRTGRRKGTSETVYYTGKAGEEFVAYMRENAFIFDTIEEAIMKTMTLNQMTGLHNITFTTEGVQ